MQVPQYKGPCWRCGEYIEKYVRPGKRPFCLECGILRVEERAREMADPTSDAAKQQRILADWYRVQFSRGEGDWYEKWRQGIVRHAMQQATTKDLKAATLPTEKKTTKRGRTRRT